MGMSDRRKLLRAKRKTQKAAKMANPGRDSVYARKLRGIYPANSPYLTGDWGPAIKIDNFFVPEPVPHRLSERARQILGALVRVRHQKNIQYGVATYGRFDAVLPPLFELAGAGLVSSEPFGGADRWWRARPEAVFAEVR